MENEAAAIFADLGIQVVTGRRFLGGFIGNHSEGMSMLCLKFDGGWDILICCLRLF